VATDDQIDELYRLPLDEFTAARNALAKSLKGDAAKALRALAKPTVVPWAVNQVYWRARATYDRLLKSGERLRAAQVAALEGRPADVRDADEAHRRAISDAVAEAERLAASSGSQPGGDALARTFEALSLARTSTERPGRLTQPLQPGGFEALAGIRLREPEKKPAGGIEHAPSRAASHAAPATPKSHTLAPREDARQRAEAERARKRADELKAAEAAVMRAEKTEKAQRAAWEEAHDALLQARRALLEVRGRRSGA
jgi:hypothetical protein